MIGWLRRWRERRRTVWVAGRFVDRASGANAWELLGVFRKRESAVARCTGEHDFVGPVPLDGPLGDDLSEWPGVEYPNL